MPNLDIAIALASKMVQNGNRFSSICIPTQHISTLAETNILLESSQFNYLIDSLFVFCNGEQLSLGKNYTLNTNSISIDLVNWSTNLSDVFDFKIFKNNIAVADNTLINNKIKTMTYTASTSGVTNVSFSPLIYDPLHDEMTIIDLKYSEFLDLNDNFTFNANGYSIDLVNWSLDINNKLKFTVTHGVM